MPDRRPVGARAAARAAGASKYIEFETERDWKQGAAVIGDRRNRRAIGFCVECGSDRESPAGRAAARSQGRGLAHSLVST